MRIDIFRVIAFISAAVLLVVVVFSFFASPHIGSAYLRIIKNLGNDLPLLTKDFSLPLLGNENNPFSTFPERSVWCWCLWLIFICWPIALLIWVLRVPDFEKITARWCLSVIAYLSLTGAVALIGIVGLLLPFTNL